MKQLTFLTKFFFLALAISFWSSCTDDGTGGGGTITLPPVIELKSGADLITSATTVDAGAAFNVNVSADKGDNDMTSFTVLEDGIAIDASRLNYNGAGAGVIGNPYTLTTAEGTTFDTNIAVTAHSDGGTRTYTFRITDSVGETDDTSVEITVVTTPLTLGIGGANGGITSNVTLPNQTNFKVELTATKGGSPLNTLTVFEDGVAVDASRVRFGVDNDILAATTATANPIGLIDDEKNAFNWFVWVSSHDAGTKAYTFELEDEAGNKEATLPIEITIAMQTAVVELTGKLLKNSAGPTGTGGIDLLTGNGTGSTDASAHLRDQGIDVGLPNSDWIRKVAPVNSSMLRTAGTDFPIDDFNAVQFAEDISIAFDNGADATISDKVNIGDIFLVRAATGQTILVLVSDIVETTDSGNNDDYYNLSIKY